jgi:hypothetical protein
MVRYWRDQAFKAPIASETKTDALLTAMCPDAVQAVLLEADYKCANSVCRLVSMESQGKFTHD